MPEEMRFLMRSAAYSLFVGVVYWLLTYEAGGTVLLIGAGVVAAFLFSMIWFELRRSGRRLEGPAWRWALLPASDAESHLTDESGRLPRSSYAPLSAGAGVALIGLGLVFGAAIAAAGFVPLVAGLYSWVRDAMAEYEAVDTR
jgi:Flp pilus assembly protein TadB